MLAFRCPSCATTKEPVLRLGAAAICAVCGHSLIINEAGVVRQATAADLDGLTPADRAALTKARSSIARPERRSR